MSVIAVHWPMDVSDHNSFHIRSFRKHYKRKKLLIRDKYNKIVAQRVSFHKRRIGAAKLVQQDLVTKSEIYLFDDEQEDCMSDII